MSAPDFLHRVLTEQMAIPIRRCRPPALALAIGLSCALAPPAGALQTTRVMTPGTQNQDLPPGMLDAGTEAPYVFTIEARTIVRDGQLVRFRLLAANPDGADRYDSLIEVDCAHRTRRQVSATAQDSHGQVTHYGDETGKHVVSKGTRADKELRLACARAGLVAADPPSAPSAAADLVDAGSDGEGGHAIFIDSVQRRGERVDYIVQVLAPGATTAVRQRYVVDCDRKLRAREDDQPEGARLAARRVAPASREARELASACAMPEGPRQRWFAGVVVSRDGVVVAPHVRTYGCTAFSTGYGASRRSLTFIANEEDLTLLRMPADSRVAVLPATDTVSSAFDQPVTMMGVSGVAPRVSAGIAKPAGSNDRDPGWPQVLALSPGALQEGVVWGSAGTAIGVAVAKQSDDGRHALMRMLPVAHVRTLLALHGLRWDPMDRPFLNTEDAMRLALAATVPLLCERPQ